MSARAAANSHGRETVRSAPGRGRRQHFAAPRRLVEAACDWAREQGFTQIQLSTFRHIPWNAPFYARLGFRELADSELGPDLLAERRHEADAGLDMTKRVFMRRELDA